MPWTPPLVPSHPILPSSPFSIFNGQTLIKKCTSAMKLLLLLFFFLIPLSSSSSSSHNNQELHLLLQFKNSLPNPSILPSWAPRHTPCSFFGISCSSSSSTITTVNLTGIPLTATLTSLSSTLLLLPHLLSLSLSSTNLSSSSSPTTLSCGPHLTTLDLSLNSLSDSALFSSCPSLNSLNLSGNLLSSFSFRSGAAGIETLDLSYNRIYNIPTLPNTVKNLNLSGNIIAGEFILPDCSVLESLDVSDNHLGGEIGSGLLARCGRLNFLNLSSNHFAGGFPMGLEALDVADFSNNNFSGEIPGEVFRSLPSLRVLQLSFNNFSGKLENWVFNLSKLELLDLSSNRLSGSIPPCTSQNSVLRELYLQDNLFLGRIPASISNCTSLYSLDLSFNYLSGSIPPSLGSLSRLKDLILWQNLLAGEIPSDFNRLSGLENLILDDNVLTGPIPEGLSNCTNLNWLSLATNHLSGEIPSWIGKLENLAILKLGNNSFSGGIPEELGDCKSLIWLDLNSNNLSGRIPASLAKQSGNIAAGLVTGKRYVYLKNDGSKECHGAGNLLEFAGIRQEQLSRLPSRKSCNFTRIYGGNTQYTFNKNGSMIFLDLSYNQLEGEIPKEIGTMYYLSVLNLGHNLLSGQIPPDLGSLRFVGVFDLSHNMLQGPIPSSFSGLSLLSEIDLSNNKLNGTIPELGQLATFPSYRYENNSGLCGFPLPVCPKNTDRISSENTSSNTRRTYIVTFISTGLLLIVLFIFVAVIFALEIKKKRLKKLKSNTKEDNSRSNSGSANNSNWKLTGTKEALSIGLATFDDKPLQKLTFADLLEATNGFHDNSLIGSGGFGDVYKAQLKDGKTVAVKKLIHISGQGEREFMAEMETIGKVKHRNLVPLLGYCKVREERLLVYEYMKYGSLEDVLHDRRRAGIKLNWAARRKIAIGAARGLAFLHHNCIPHIIHRDMKSSNVLLDENFEARVSDFGMARMMNVTETHLSVSTVAGTPGYVPPEYYDSFRCTTKGDVYSYGVVLLELLTGKKSTDSSDFGDSNLVGWVKMHSKIKISDVFDKELLREDPSLELELLQHLKIACACLDDRPMRRPTMVKVMAMFKEIQAGPAVLVDSAPYSTANSVGEGSFDAADLSLKEEKEDKD